MSLYRPRNRGALADSYRSSTIASGGNGGIYYDDRPSSQPDHPSGRRSSLSPRRRSPPQDSYRAPHRRDSTSRGHTRDWDGRSDRDRDRGRYRDRSRSRSRSRVRDRGTDHSGRSASPRRSWRGRYRDWDREDPHPYRNSRSRSRSPNYSRSRSRSRVGRRSGSPYYGGPPSRDVIMEGLPAEMDSDDGNGLRLVIVERELQVAEELDQGYHVDGLRDVRVIKDRQSGVSRQFGFMHFVSVQAARVFLDKNYPYIYLYGRGSGGRSSSAGDQATKVRVSFSRERDDRDRGGRPEDEWVCLSCSFPNFARRSECRRCLAQRTESAGSEMNAGTYRFTNTGDSDVSPDGTASQFLLFRGLEASVTVQLLAKGAAKLYKSARESPTPAAGPAPPPASGLKRSGVKVSSAAAGANLGAREGSVRRALLVKDRRTDESWRYGFVEFASVEDSQAALAKFNSLEKFTISSKPVLLSFVHTGVFVPVFNYTPAQEKFTFSPFNNPSMRLAYWDEEAYVSELILASDDHPTEPTSVATKRNNASEKSKDAEGKGKKRKATEASVVPSNKKAVPAHLNFWRNRHAELHGISTDESENSSDGTSLAKAGNGAKGRGGGTGSNAKELADDGSPPVQSYADMSRKCCLLCARQFKTDAEVNRHERLSQLHRNNLKNDEIRAKAVSRLAKAGIEVVGDARAYRDRAKERRATYNQPRRPLPAGDSLASASRSGELSPSATAIKHGDDADAPLPPSKGAALLGKMGWTAGAGLGAQGTGIVTPVATDMYVAGVGLGAEGGRVGDAVAEAERNTTGGYGEFLERTKDKAKERFQKMTTGEGEIK